MVRRVRGHNRNAAETGGDDGDGDDGGDLDYGVVHRVQGVLHREAVGILNI